MKQMFLFTKKNTALRLKSYIIFSCNKIVINLTFAICESPPHGIHNALDPRPQDATPLQLTGVVQVRGHELCLTKNTRNSVTFGDH
jgi:hypothetical protein